jgi:transposase
MDLADLAAENEHDLPEASHPAPAHRPAAPRHCRPRASSGATGEEASWILTPPGDLTDHNRAALAQITGRCEELKQTGALVREFADMLCNRRGERLEARASQAQDSPVSELRGFAKGLRSDWAAVTAGLTVSYSSGAVEGHVNRIKMIKRQMYGRAKPDLLRKRVLLAD